MSINSLKTHKKTLINIFFFSGLSIVVGFQSGAILIIPFAVIIIVMCILSVVITYAITGKQCFKQLILSSGIVSLILPGQYYLAYKYQTIANNAVHFIKTYYVRHGHYPSQTFFWQQDNQGSWREIHLYYLYNQEQTLPLITYKNPNTVFDDYIYNFECDEWDFKPN